MNTGELKYVGFGKRFCAMWLDFLVMLPLIAPTIWGDKFRLFQVCYFLPSIAFGLFYNTYLVKRYGGTPGKLIMGIRIVKVDGTPVTYREAFLRYAPEFTLGLLMSASAVYAMFQMTNSEYSSLSFMERSKRLAELEPWGMTIQIINTIWVWGEFVVLLTNKKRRALHDFIAGTVVIEKKTIEVLPPIVPSVSSSE